MNNVILIGRLTKGAELTYLNNGNKTPVAKGTIAVNRDYKNKDGTIPTDFIPFEIMGKTAEAVVNYTHKGSQIAIEGSVRVENYESNGQKKTFTKVFVNRVQFLDSKKDNTSNNQGTQNPSFSAVEDDDVPF